MIPDQEPQDILSEDYMRGYNEDKAAREDELNDEPSFWRLMATQTYLLEKKHELEADGKRGTPEFRQLAELIVKTNQLLWH